MIQKINSDQFASVEAADVAIVDFNATWCGPCRMMHPVLEELSGEKPNISFFAVDVDDNADLAMRFNVSSIPCLVMLKKGVETARTIGFQPKPVLESWVDQNA